MIDGFTICEAHEAMLEWSKVEVVHSVENLLLLELSLKANVELPSEMGKSRWTEDSDRRLIRWLNLSGETDIVGR